ncbi:MAG: amidohydrolase [Flavobacteriaceae bacterium]|nr:amidohydrolase [Flavobacteriaceae bacterium]|tara:strand:- start:4492 stop:5514 length:1023 start_codon:yes stop_codon:yes gene_type:complete
MDIETYSPISTLVTKETLLKKSKFPFVDVHNHQFDMPIKDLNKLTTEMDSLNMAYMINLSGFRGIYLEKSLKNIKENAPTRFGLFLNINFEEIDNEDFASSNVKLIEEAFNNGVIGLKVYKSLGLTDKDKNGQRIKINDPRLNPIWRICGKLGIPVLIHSGEPESFWHDKDKYNERWLELRQKPNRYRGDSLKFPSFDKVIAEQHDIFKNNPKTIFINAHLGWMGNDLDKLSEHLDKHQNVMTEIGAILAELGRQPIRARKFFIDYKDRILFGKDAYRVSEYYTYFRVLETDDEYFDYYRKRHAHWKMYGLSLPDSVLKAVYYQNALKLFPSIDKKLFNL